MSQRTSRLQHIATKLANIKRAMDEMAVQLDMLVRAVEREINENGAATLPPPAQLPPLTEADDVDGDNI